MSTQAANEGPVSGQAMKVSLRPAAGWDADGITEVLIRSRSAFMPYAPSVHTAAEIRAWVEGILLPGAAVTVAVQGGTVVGMIAVRLQASTAWIDQMYLRPESVGQGIGSLLLRHALGSDPRPVRLRTFQENQGARRFYERHGFKPVAFSDGHANEEHCPDVTYECRQAPSPVLPGAGPLLGSPPAMDHEREFVKAFLVSGKRARWIQFLSDPKRRREVLGRLDHHLPLLPGIGTEVPPERDFPTELELLLRSRGAGPTCHVLVDGLRIDGRELPLAQALREICLHPGGAVLSCLPGRLAYYKPASPGCGILLERPPALRAGAGS